VWGSEFASKAAAIQGGSNRNRCWAERKIVDFGGGAWLVVVASNRFLAKSYF
jgi:hypothetical protein